MKGMRAPRNREPLRRAEVTRSTEKGTSCLLVGGNEEGLQNRERQGMQYK